LFHSAFFDGDAHAKKSRMWLFNQLLSRSNTKVNTSTIYINTSTNTNIHAYTEDSIAKKEKNIPIFQNQGETCVIFATE
jgi:Na+/H+ antiporter NhaB